VTKILGGQPGIAAICHWIRLEYEGYSWLELPGCRVNFCMVIPQLWFLAKRIKQANLSQTKSRVRWVMLHVQSLIVHYLFLFLLLWLYMLDLYKPKKNYRISFSPSSWACSLSPLELRTLSAASPHPAKNLTKELRTGEVFPPEKANIMGLSNQPKGT
jgi:hypothetical protein